MSQKLFVHEGLEQKSACYGLLRLFEMLRRMKLVVIHKLTFKNENHMEMQPSQMSHFVPTTVGPA